MDEINKKKIEVGEIGQWVDVVVAGFLRDAVCSLQFTVFSMFVFVLTLMNRSSHKKTDHRTKTFVVGMLYW